MKELIALLVVVAVSAAIYIGVEPFAHGQMYPKVQEADFAFSDLKPLEAQEGDIAQGEELVMANCTACHGISVKGVASPFGPEDAIAAYGVVPPDLSTAGLLYEKNFLGNFIKDPAIAAKQTHKFVDTPHPMPAYNWMSDQEIAHIVAFLQSIAPQKLSDKEVFMNACARCHNIRYDNGHAHGNLQTYLGANVPDLSMIIRSRHLEYLETFINDPQKNLPGTAMPRVGLTQQSQAQVIAYLESVGDSKKQERESLGYKIIIFFVVMGIVAYLWKRKVWRDVH